MPSSATAGLLRLATFFYPSDDCWGPDAVNEGRIGCLPSLPSGGLHWGWWRHGGPRAGPFVASDQKPHQPPPDERARSELVAGDGKDSQSSDLLYVPCTCALGGRCSFYSAVTGSHANELYAVDATPGATPMYAAPEFDARFGGAFGAHENAQAWQLESAVVGMDRAAREPVPPFRPISRPLSHPLVAGGCGLVLTDVLGGQHTAAEFCRGRDGAHAACLWVFERDGQPVSHVRDDGEVEDLAPKYVEALAVLRPRLGGSAAPGGKVGVTHSALEESLALDVPSTDAPFLGGNFAFEGARPLAHAPPPGETRAPMRSLHVEIPLACCCCRRHVPHRPAVRSRVHTRARDREREGLLRRARQGVQGRPAASAVL